MKSVGFDEVIIDDFMEVFMENLMKLKNKKINAQ